MASTRLFGWLDPRGDRAVSLAPWCRSAGAAPALCDGALEIWTWPDSGLRILDKGPIGGVALGSVYGVPEGLMPSAIAEAGRAGRLHRLDGRFCAVLRDRDRGSLSLFRDASSAMFLFYRTLPGGGLVFSDDLDLLAKSPGPAARISGPGLHEYLRLLDIATPNTVYEGIRSPEPGRELVLVPGAEPRPRPGPEPEPVASAASRRIDLEPAADRVAALLEAAVAKRLPPEGPVLAFLSGGVDSALIAAIAARLAPGRVTAYTVGFEEAGFDETPVAAAIAEHLRLPHRVLRLPLSAYRSAFDALTRDMAYPFADPTMVPTLLAFEEARGLAPFALDGTGAEVCVGTMPARHVRLATQYGARLPRPLRRAGAGALKRLGPLAGLAPLIDFEDPEEMTMRWRGWTRPEIEQLCGSPVAFDHTRFYRVYRSFPMDRHFDRYTGLLSAMPDDRIHEIGRLTGLEVRFPFFDPELAGYIGTLPLAHRHPPEEPKRILRHLLARHVPRRIWDLPKHGFDFPFADFMAMDDYALVREYLPRERVADSGLVSPEIVGETVARLRAGERGLAFRVWALVVLFAWLENHWRRLRP